MNTITSACNHTSDTDQPSISGEMSVDGSLLDKESPPPYITFRKGISNINDTDLREQFRTEFKKMQTDIKCMLEAWFTKQDERFSLLLTEFEGVKASIHFMSENYDDLEKKTRDVASRVSAIEKKLSSPQANEQRVVVLEAKLEAMEQKSRSCNAEISNLPEKRGENLIAITETISKVIKQPLSLRDIIAIHRVPQMNPDSNRPKNIIVKFSSKILRDNFIAAARLKKGISSEELMIHGTPQKVYINEHLTLQNKKLFRQAREIAKQNGNRFVWIKHGVILVRADISEAAFAIRTEHDLSKIKPYSSSAR